jgi:putative heme iron utilization protein
MAERREEAERDAQRGLEERGGVELVRELLGRERAAVLATASAELDGHPFASLVPFAVSHAGEPLLLLSALAQHTRNLAADPRACLFVHDAAAAARDPRTAARAAILGRVQRVTGDGEADGRSRYLARHPDARGLLALDFALHLLVVERVQVVAGFGAAGWIPGKVLREP